MTAKTYDRQTAKFLAVVGENMPEMSGEVMQGWIQNPMALQKFLEGLRPSEASPEFRVWKTIKLGLRKSPEEYRKSLKDGKYRIGDYANQILDKIPISQEEVKVDLVRLTGRELGFKESVRRDVIYNRALECGLQKCPGEVGPVLREQYSDQQNGEWVLIGMEPITDSDGNLDVFSVRRNDSGLWLFSYWGSPDGFWGPDYLWVFVRPRK